MRPVYYNEGWWELHGLHECVYEAVVDTIKIYNYAGPCLVLWVGGHWHSNSTVDGS